MRRLSLALALPLVALASGCGEGPAIPDTDLSVRVTAVSTVVDLGRAFPLTVSRVWSKGLAPAAWSDRALSPLVVRLEETTRREDGRRVEETRRFRAYALTRNDVTIPAVSFVAKSADGGPERRASSTPLFLRVRHALEPDKPGPPELPGPAPEEPLGWTLPAVVGAAAVVVSALVAAVARRRLRRRRAGAAVPVGPAAPPAHAEALARLSRIRAREPAGVEDVREDFVGASAVLRDYVAARFSVRADVATTEELVADPATGSTGDAPRARLSAALGSCDLVKFAAHAPTPADRTRVLDAAEAFVRETAGSVPP